MRRFLDWTSGQTAGQLTPAVSSSDRRSPRSHQDHHLQQQISSSPSSSLLLMQQQSTNSAKDLEIQHLTKLLHEIKIYQASSSPLPSAVNSQSHLEFVEKVHKTLPLFLNLFGSIPTCSGSSGSSGGSAFITNENSFQSSIDQLENVSFGESTTSSKQSSPLPQRSPQLDRLPDLLPFAFTIARLFVSEVRQRASNKHAEDASLAILQFLNFRSSSTTKESKLDDENEDQNSVRVKTTGEIKTQGWNLLLSLNTLSSTQNPQIIQQLCDASLPSTLIKCLYLFFDLPDGSRQKQQQTSDSEKEERKPTQLGGDALFAQEITSGPLIRAFTQLLFQLCSNQSAIDELMKKDDLRLLIGIASSQCSSHNRAWRRTASQTLLAISRNMRDNFLYLEQNICIQVYVENMFRINSLCLATTDEFIHMIKTLLEFLYNLDVNNRNQPRSIAPLVEQFKNSRIVDLIEELLYKIDDMIMQESQNASITGHQSDSNSQQPSISSEFSLCIDEYRRGAKRLLQSLTIMAKINTSQDSMASIVTLKPLTANRFEMLEQFKMPRPSARNCILNFDVLRLFKMAWSRCQDFHVIESILDATISLFTDDKYNYFIFESQQLLVYYMTSNNFKLFPYKLKQKLFKFLEFIIIEINYIPCLELGTLGTIIKQKATSDANLILGLRTLIACLRFNPKFSDIFRETGLLEVIVTLLIETMQQGKFNQSANKLEVLYLLLEASQHLLAGPNNLNCTQFNESGAARHVFNCLSKSEFFHLFIPVHSSSSDEGYTIEPHARTSTPPFSASHTKSHQIAHQITHHQHYLSESSLGLSYNKPSIKQLQKVSFTIIRQLILSSAGDEHLANLLGLLARNLDDLKQLGDANDVNDDNTGNSKIHSRRLSFTLLLSQEVNLKICILKSLMIVLKDSHRCRALFRKAGGFTYIVSSLNTIERSLPSCELASENEIESYQRWRKIHGRRIWRLIKNSFMTIVVALRFEPINLRAFSEDVIDKFTDAIRRLGCFKPNQRQLPSRAQYKAGNQMNNFNLYKAIFLAPTNSDFSTACNDNIKPHEACCQLFRFLYDMSLNFGDGTSDLEIQLELQKSMHVRSYGSSHETKSISFDQGTFSMGSSRESNIFRRRSQLHLASRRPPSLDLNAKNIESAILTFPCIIITILDLIPSCPSEDLMIFTCLVIRSLIKHERNQQLLCEAGMISKLLELSWRNSITEKNHFLHETSVYMLEKLSKQSISAKELRLFFRLGDPLKCKNLDEIEITESYDETRQKLGESSNKNQSILDVDTKPKEKILTERIETFLSMMANEQSKTQPPFVEFDMRTDGFSLIFMPSIAPINAKTLPANASSFLNSTLDVHTSEKNGILGGVGSVERNFPPVTGFTFSTWLCIEKFPARSSDATHNLRLLTIYRGSAATGKEYSCFKVQVSALDRSLTVSTQETLLFDIDNRPDSQLDPDCNLSIWTPELLLEGKWHHIAITMNRSLLKQSIIHVYVDGVLVHNQRICYISSYVGTTNTGPLGNSNSGVTASSAAAYVNAFIGSLPQFRMQLRTQWKQGPCHMIEEPLSANFISVIYALGPSFIGNFQGSYKLNDLAKARGGQLILQTLKHVYPEGMSTNHKPLIHQQSAAVSQSPHGYGTPVTRVASTNLSSSQHQSSSSSHTHSQYIIPEDRILMSIDARATSLITLSRMRRIYTRFDCRQVSRVLGLAMHENSTPILLLHNTGVHLNGSSRGVGALTIGYNHVRCFVPSPTQCTLYNIGGCYILLGLVAQAQTMDAFCGSLKSLVAALKYNTDLQAQMENINGYQFLAVLFWKKKHILNSHILKITFSLITDDAKIDTHPLEPTMMIIQQVGALRELICECFDLWLQTEMINLVLEFIHNLISSTIRDKPQGDPLSYHSGSVRVKNLKCLRDLDLLPRMLRLLPQYDSQNIDTNIMESDVKDLLENNGSSRNYDIKAVYLIKQTVFELLNRTPRQSDILYFGQFLASLLPSRNKERSMQTISLRNTLLKSLLQMMTKNKQKEVNNAMQEELVRILGFDWFMLFISGPHLNGETLTIGFLSMMIILSNDDLYATFKSKSTTHKGGWLKEPTFSSMDGRFNIQLLGMNVGAFFGLSGKKKSIRTEILEAPNFFLLNHCLTNLFELPRIYLMIFQTMMSGLTRLESVDLETIETFDKLNLDILCDILVGDTHHKRRKTLSSVQFKCHELVVCLIYMIREIMSQYELEDENRNLTDLSKNYPTDIVRFLMYLYNNNQDFQLYCRSSDELIDALCEALTKSSNTIISENRPIDETPNEDRKPFYPMTQHPASKELLELSRLIILDTMTDSSQSNEVGTIEQLHIFERFLNSLTACKEAQGELVDMLLRQILLMIDSTARHNTMETIGKSDNVLQFQLLLVNSITISQVVLDKIWLNELYKDSISRILTMVDHQLCLTEQIFNFSELLPRHSPPHAFNIQRVLNRIILFGLSRPIKNMQDKILFLNLLKKIHDNRTIIILNHMHSPQSAEFFVCFTYCLIKIIEDNSANVMAAQHSIMSEKPTSLIERQYGHPNNQTRSDSNSSGQPSSTALMLISMARKIWDAIYQSKKGLLSEALDVSLSLPAFTLDTSPDLIQLKPDIIESCEKFWSNLLEDEQRTRRRIQNRQNEPAPGTATSSTVNLLSGRLTRVVNAANFVSRVVGATAGTMASNVNLVGEKLSQNRVIRKESTVRNSSDTSGPFSSAALQNNPVQGGTPAHVVSSPPSQTDKSIFIYPGIIKSQLEEATQTHISIIENYIEGQMSQKNHKIALHKYLCVEWLDTESEILTRERALFGPDYGSKLDKWCLDMTEGPKRMRKKMINYTRQFYDNYPYRPEQYNPSNKSLRYRPPMSYDSHLYYMRTINMHDHLLELDEQMMADKTFNGCTIEDESAIDSIQRSVSPASAKPPAKVDDSVRQQKSLTNDVISLSPIEPTIGCQTSIESPTPPTNIRIGADQVQSPRPSDGDGEDGDSNSFVDFSPEIEAETNSARDLESTDSLSVLRLLEKNERISHMFRCSRVQGLDTYEGLLLFGREHFYLIDGFTLLKTREIKDIESLPPDAHDPIIPNSTPNILAHSKKTCAKFSFDGVVEVHKRRYLLQPIALEVFSSDGRNTLIVFPRNIRNKVYSRLMTVSTQLTSNAHESLAGQKSNVSVEGGSGLLSNLIGETSVTQRWVRGELSNFQYLMNLNTIAGRSYNDLMQYPIFPWILADYTSDYLDLTKLSTFRDLSRPVGAQTSERLEQFKRRYAEWDDNETPPYHYGTFYSSAMIVASYMVRMEPFTQHFLRLQGGHFDLADRMFHSINDSWLSASKHNMADIKELVPEFFYLPEFLTNANKYDLGIKQSGMKLDNVILPPWAKNDTREFIRLHRCALESDYVSAHLHEWIDLIFGYKQQGQAAVDAVNVFHHLFYEGNVDIYNTDIDPIKKNAVIGFINNFGQVPKQLFKKPHPVRKITSFSGMPSSMPLPPILPTLSTASSSNSLQRVITYCPQALKQINMTLKDLRGPVGQIVQFDKNIVAVEQNKLLIPPEYCRYIAWGHADRSLRLGLYDSEKPIFVWEGSDSMSPNEILCCTIPNNRIMVTAGTESLITVWKIEKMRSFSPMLNLYGHVEPITCLASSQPYGLIVSGSRDRTAIIWDLNRFTFVRQLGGGPKNQQVHHGPISAIAINDLTGDIATCASSWLYLWTINGELLARIDSLNITMQQSMCRTTSISSNPGQLHILSVCFSQHNEWDLDEVIVTGASDGSVCIWSMRYYQAPMSKSEIEEADQRLKDSNLNSVQDEELRTESRAESDPPQVTEGNENFNQHNLGEVFEETKLQGTSVPSEPINIVKSTRQRTDTINSDWVRLSASSTSTADTIPVLRATPTSCNDQVNESLLENDIPADGDMNCSNQVRSPEQPTCSTSIAPFLDGVEGDGTKDSGASDTKKSDGCRADDGASSTGNLSMICDELDGQSMSKANLFLVAQDPSLMKFSKSDTSLVDSFVILGDSTCDPTGMPPNSAVNQTTGDRVRPQSSASSRRGHKKLNYLHRDNERVSVRNSCKLIANHCWRRELYLRNMLPRRDGRTIPPAVTSLAISKDHKTLYVGDISGRITSWTTA